ncbi:hypothetical protein ACFL0P_00180 [Candidatus Omnitrophota bacterium]
MKIGKYLLVALVVMGFASMVYAAPVGLTSEADATKSVLWPEKDYGISAALIGDFVTERKINIDSGNFEMRALMLRLGLSLIDRLNFYVDLGQAQDMEYTYLIMGEKHELDFDDDFIYGVGLSALVYRWDNGLEIGANVSYRQAEMSLDTVVKEGTTYEKGSGALSAINSGKFQETQTAIELAWKTDYLIPYVGIKYSDVDVDADYTLLGALVDANKSASENIGLFVGLTITPKLQALPNEAEQISINVEGRFVDEEAINAGITYKF